MSRYHHNKVTHELEPIAGYGSRVATSVDGKTLTVHSSILNIDGYNYGEGDIATAINMIAPIESSLVASKAYAVGDQFVYNGLLYKVTAAIASGGAIVIGTNCEVAPCVAEQIQTLAKNKNLQYTDVTFTNIAVTANSYSLLGEYPSNAIMASIKGGNFNGINSAKIVTLDPNGKAYLFNGSDSGTLKTVIVRYLLG